MQPIHIRAFEFKIRVSVYKPFVFHFGWVISGFPQTYFVWSNLIILRGVILFVLQVASPIQNLTLTVHNMHIFWYSKSVLLSNGTYRSMRYAWFALPSDSKLSFASDVRFCVSPIPSPNGDSQLRSYYVHRRVHSVGEFGAQGSFVRRCFHTLYP